MKYTVIGAMSGTSMDGLDISCCTFIHEGDDNWQYSINSCDTIGYSNYWLHSLKNAVDCKGYELIKLHYEYGKFIGDSINGFIKKNSIDKSKIDLIASHGHTLFHKPHEGLTFQLGLGASIAASTGIRTVSDFRSLDVALGGHGAPLVPIGDKLLFTDYNYCLNLGGFSNLSYDYNGKRIAYDICPVNIVINQLALHKDLTFDKDGHIASMGEIHNDLLVKLDNLEYYKQSPPKSLGREWLEEYFIPILTEYHKIQSTENILRTVYEHIANQISRTIILFNNQGKILITGGGVKNLFLIQILRNKLKDIQLVIPDVKIIDHKESLIFAFLGLLRFLNKENCLASVTGARQDNIGGNIFEILQKTGDTTHHLFSPNY